MYEGQRKTARNYEGYILETMQVEPYRTWQFVIATTLHSLTMVLPMILHILTISRCLRRGLEKELPLQVMSGLEKIVLQTVLDSLTLYNLVNEQSGVFLRGQASRS